MKLELKSPTMEFPPDGGFSFVDPRTNFRVNGLEGTIPQTAAKISIHRQANPTLYPSNEPQWFDIESIIQEMFQAKYKTHPYLFVGSPGSDGIMPAQSNSGGTCICGETAVEEILCPTCSGHRVIGTKCRACGATRS